MSRITRIALIFLMVFALFSSAVVPVSAEESADLAVAGIDTTALYCGISNTVVVNVNNLTSVAASDFAVTLEANGVLVGTLTNLSITGNNDPYYWPLSVSFYWSPEAEGEYIVTATVDAAGTIPEIDETNNSANTSVMVNALQSITASVRIEGISSTLWSGEVTFLTSSVTDKQGDTHFIDRPTVLGALAEAARQGGFGFVVSSAWGALSYVEQIGTDSPSGLNGWLYRVDWKSAGVSAVDYTLSDGAEVLFYYGGWDAAPLRLNVDSQSLLASETIDINVEQYDGYEWKSAAGCRVSAGARVLTADENGQIQGVRLSPGEYTLTAEKENYVTFIRSNSQTVLVYLPLLLDPGWNFVSFPRKLAAGHDTTLALFGNVDTESRSIFAYDAAEGWISLTSQDTVSPLEGLWVYSAAEIELRPVFDTNPRTVPPTRQLRAGWNAIGYSDFAVSSANSALTSVEQEWAVLIGFSSETQAYQDSIINDAPAGDAHSETREMSPWKGYWLFLTADSLLAAISS